MKKLLTLLLALPLAWGHATAQENAKYTILLTGASFASPQNGWFEIGCRQLDARAINRAIGGESIADTANRMAEGTLWNAGELDEMDGAVSTTEKQKGGEPMKRVFRNVFTVAFLLLILIGCSTTKRIADDEVLYTGVKKMEIIPDSGVKIADAAASDVRSTLSVAPNNPLFSPYIRTPFPINKIISGQTLEVDVVSGATYSSNGIISAVKNALTGAADSGTPASTSAGASGGSSSPAGGSSSVSTVQEHLCLYK